MNAVSLEVFIVRLDSLETNPTLADWIRRIIALKMLARAGIAPLWIDQFAARTNRKRTSGSAVELTKRNWIARHHHSIGTVTLKYIQAKLALAHFAMK